MQKRTAFASVLSSLFEAHDAQIVVDTKERKELEQNVDRFQRIKIMPDNKYCVIRDIGQQTFIGEGQDAAGNVVCQIAHRFSVDLFYAKDYCGSQDTFEAIVYNNRTDTKPGLLDALRADRSRVASSDNYYIGDPNADAVQNVQRGTWDFGALGGQPELAHYLRFEVLLF